MKKGISIFAAIIISVTIILPGTAFSASAAAPSGITSITEGRPYTSILNNAVSSGKFQPTVDDNNFLAVCDAVYAGLARGESDFIINIPSLDNEAISLYLDDCVDLLNQNCPYLFDWQNSIGYGDITDNSGQLHLIVVLEKNDDERRARMTEYDEMLDEIIEKIPSGLSDTAKVVFIYNYLVINYEYDTTEDEEIVNEEGETETIINCIHDGYRFLKNKTGVCQAYAEVFNSLMFKLGIPCTNAWDEIDNHVWNIVQIGGNYYHIDCTWADPVPDTYGYVSHQNLLLSDSANIEQESHTKNLPLEEEFFGYTIFCTDTTYDTGCVWDNAVSPLACYGGEFYFIENSGVVYENSITGDYETTKTIYKTNDFKNKLKVTDFVSLVNRIYNIDGTLNEANSNSCYHPFSGISLFNSQLYYNTTKEILFYDLLTSGTGSVYQASEGEELAFSYYAGNGMFHYSTMSYFTDESDESGVIYIGETAHAETSVTEYDVDGKNGIDSSDLSIVYKYLLTGQKTYTIDGESKTLCLSSISTTNENDITILDLIRMKKLCAAA